jgi:hypothetical protein
MSGEKVAVHPIDIGQLDTSVYEEVQYEAQIKRWCRTPKENLRNQNREARSQTGFEEVSSHRSHTTLMSKMLRFR